MNHPLALSERIRTCDGGQISLDWVDNQESAAYPVSSTRPTLLILPGLTGNSKQSYVLHATRQATRRGYRSAPVPGLNAFDVSIYIFYALGGH